MITESLLRKEENKSKEELLKELKVLRAQQAVLREAEEERKKAEEEVNLLQSLLFAMSEVEDLSTALEVALCKICQASGWDVGEAWIPSLDGNFLERSPAWYTKEDKYEALRNLSEDLKLAYGVGLAGRAWQSKSPIWIKDVTNDPNFLRSKIASDLGLQAGLAIPIIAHEKLIAVIVFFIKQAKEEDTHLVSLISTVARQISIVFERKQLERQYKILFERFSGIYNSSNYGIGYCTLDGMLLDANDAFFKITGYTKEEIINKKKYQDITPPEYHEYQTKLMEKVLQTGEPIEYEKEYIRKDGSRVPILATAYVVKSEDGQPLGLAAIIKDISERKKAEKELKILNESLEEKIKERTQDLLKINNKLRTEITFRMQTEGLLRTSEEKYKQLNKLANDAIFLADAETGIILEANKQAEKLIGLPLEKIIGIHQSELHPKEEVEKYKKLFEEHVKSPGSISEEVFVWHKEGYKVPVEISANVIDVGDKKVIQGIFRDIRRWKQAEDERRKLAFIVQSSNDAIMSLTLDGFITSWNPASEKIFGYTASEIKGKHCSILAPHDFQGDLQEFHRRISHGETIEHFETIRQRKDGTKINVSITVSPVKDNTGNIIGRSAIVRDITEQRKLEVELEKARIKEEQEKEITLLEELASSQSRKDLITQLFSLTPLSKSHPAIFNELSMHYQKLIELTQQENSDKDTISKELRTMSDELCSLKAGPSDLMEIHSITIKRKNINGSQEDKTYSEKARLLVLELMGYLISNYRKQSLLTQPSSNGTKRHKALTRL